MVLILLVKVQSGVFTANRREAQGGYREVVAEGSVEQNFEPMNKNLITRPSGG
jgi:hypothetical protein